MELTTEQEQVLDDLKAQLEEDGRPEVELIGQDGNAFAILAACKRAARNAGWTKDQISAVQQKMMSGDYNNLLATAQEFYDVN